MAAHSTGAVKPRVLTKKDFETDQEPRWCPGCGDYSILTQIRKVLPQIGVPKENIVFVAGIGCSRRFPYYVDTYGIHSIHGRALAIASGIKIAKPELSVWVATGDGDAMSIGGNHFIHLFRRNINVNIIMFNNQIYGLTKGQYSPTSEIGKITRSSPQGSLDRPFNPVKLALASGATFVARTLDRDPPHMVEIFKQAVAHKGSSFVEVYQNCNIFNDGAFFHLTEKDKKDDNALFLEHGKPLVFSKEKGIHVDGKGGTVIDINDNSAGPVTVFDKTDTNLANLLAEMTYNKKLPTPIGVFREVEESVYEEMLDDQVKAEVEKKKLGDLHSLLHSGDVWTVS